LITLAVALKTEDDAIVKAKNVDGKCAFGGKYANAE
jgi:hypothetical protein